MALPFITEFFGNLPDPRVERTRHYPLIEIVAVSVLAVMCGAEGWSDIRNWGTDWAHWLRKHFRLRRGIPSKDVYRRVFAALDPTAFNACFSEWVRSFAVTTANKAIAIDGKTLRGSFQTKTDKGKKGAIHIVSAWVDENCVVFGQIATERKSNEITAIPVLLDMLSLDGSVITIDAMGCQKKIVNQIIDGNGDYVISAKDNQPTLRTQIEEAFITADIAGELDNPECSCETSEAGHGRHEVRKVTVLDADRRLDDDLGWVGLTSIVMLESTRTICGRTSEETRYYISSLDPDPKLLAKRIRSHWGIEIKQHWTLDTAFNEDGSRIRKDNAPENFALLRRIALNLLNLDTSSKTSMRSRRRRAGANERCLDKTLECIATILSA